jgi:hypothetical protein
MNEVARTDIEELLERYRRAYEARSFTALQQAFPTVPKGIENQFKQIRSLKYTFTGAPKYVQLDAFGGTAIVEIGTQQTTETSMGSKRPSIDFVERIDIRKRGADNQWIIATVNRTQK